MSNLVENPIKAIHSQIYNLNARVHLLEKALLELDNDINRLMEDTYRVEKVLIIVVAVVIILTVVEATRIMGWIL